MKVLLWIKYLRIYHEAWFFGNKITFDRVSLWKIISEIFDRVCWSLAVKPGLPFSSHRWAFCTTIYFKTNHSLCFYLISRLARKLARRRRTNLLLIAVSVIFFTSWFPLNTLNMVMDIFGHHLEAVTQEVVMEIIKPWFKLRKMVFDWNRLVLSTTLWPTTGVGRNFKEFIHFRPKYKCTLSSHLIFRCFGANLLKNYFRTRCFSLSLAATSLPPARSAQTQSCKIFLFSYSFNFGFAIKHWNMTPPAKQIKHKSTSCPNILGEEL